MTDLLQSVAIVAEGIAILILFLLWLGDRTRSKWNARVERQSKIDSRERRNW